MLPQEEKMRQHNNEVRMTNSEFNSRPLLLIGTLDSQSSFVIRTSELENK